MGFEVETVKAPRLTGAALRAVAALVERPLAGAPVRAQMRAQVGLDRLRAAEVGAWSAERPPFRVRPEDRPEADAPPPAALAEAAAALAPGAAAGWQPLSVADYQRAYTSGASTPVEVAERVLAGLRASDADAPPLHLMIAQHPADLRAQAEASAARWREGRPLGPLDGVPVAIKDEVDMAGYATTAGTRPTHPRAVAADATTVARLRAAGALLIGKANMHELGMGVTGINPHHGAVRNPYAPGHVTGGSSSASAAAVAAGLCPVALGADGGGSIRIPAAFCGVVGLKATFGRVSEHGAYPLCWSVAHIGPLAATARDAAVAYAIMAGPDPRDPGTAAQPAVHLEGLDRGDLRGVRLGVHRPWFEAADRGVVAACDRAVAALAAAGAEIVEVALEGLELVRVAHLVLIASEMAAARLGEGAAARRRLGHDTRLTLALAGDLAATDYVQALRLRARLLAAFEDALDGVHALLTPATACAAPPLADDALASGESDLALLDRIMRFAPAPNLLGLPAISFPAGYDDDGLPVGLQALGRAWQEPLLLRLARVAEDALPRRAPARLYEPLARIAGA